MNKNIFSLPSMSDAHIYEFSHSPYDAPFYSQSFEFSYNAKKIGIIDQFNGKRPIILNKHFLDGNKLDLQIYQTLILDSHIVDTLHRFVSGCGKLDDHSREVTSNFLAHVSKLNCDYSPIFYLTENFAKSSNDVFIKTSSEKLTSILKLHSMNENEFINTGKIIYKSESIDYYCNKYQAEDLDACGDAWAREFAENHTQNDIAKITNLSYACLLKMVLIHFINPELTTNNIVKKYKEFERFLTNDINIVLARELNLALYYFSGFAGKFVSAQPNMPVERAKKTLKATAWDIFLLRLPEMLLSPKNLPELNLAYIVTSEEKLLNIGDMFNIESIFYRDKNAPASPILSFNLILFDKIISKAELNNLNDERQAQTISRITKEQKPISAQSLSWLIEDLEKQLQYLCKS